MKNKILPAFVVSVMLMPSIAFAQVKPFIGEPKTRSQLLTCDIVVSKWSKKTYYKGKDDKVIRSMAPKWAICKAPEAQKQAKNVSGTKTEQKTQAQLQLELEALNMVLYGNPTGPITKKPLAPVFVAPTPELKPVYTSPAPTQTVQPVQTVMTEESTPSINLRVTQWEEARMTDIAQRFRAQYNGSEYKTLMIKAEWDGNAMGSVTCKSPNYIEYPDGIPLHQNTFQNGGTIMQAMFGWQNYEKSVCTITVNDVSLTKTYTFHDGGVYTGEPIIRD